LFFVFLSPALLVDRWLQASAHSNANTDAIPRSTAVHAEPVGAGAYLALVVLGLGVWLVQRSGAETETDVRSVELSDFGEWTRLGAWTEPSRPVFVGATVEAAMWYSRASSRVGAYVAGYSSQAQGREVVYYANRPEGDGARVTAPERRSVSAPSASAVSFVELEVVDTNGARRLVWHQTRVAGTAATTDVLAKGLQILGALRGRTDAAALVFTTPCSVDCDSARRLLSEYAAAVSEPLSACIERAVTASGRTTPGVCHGPY
jgi:EpsI family protein